MLLLTHSSGSPPGAFTAQTRPWSCHTAEHQRFSTAAQHGQKGWTVFHFCCCDMIKMRLSGIKTSLIHNHNKKKCNQNAFQSRRVTFSRSGGFTSCKVTVGSSLESPLYLHRLMSVDIKNGSRQVWCINWKKDGCVFPGWGALWEPPRTRGLRLITGVSAGCAWHALLC